MQLVIAEKPSVGMSLAAVLGAKERKDGYTEGNGYVVSWCVGHLVGLADAFEYDEYGGGDTDSGEDEDIPDFTVLEPPTPDSPIYDYGDQFTFESSEFGAETPESEDKE